MGYYTLLIKEKAKPPSIVQKLKSNFDFNSDHLKQIFKLPNSIVVELYVGAFQCKVINSILYTDTKLFKIGFNQPESLTHLFYHCSRSKQFWIEFELYCTLFRINEFVSAYRKCALWNLDEKCVPLTSIAELFYNYWKTLFVGL